MMDTLENAVRSDKVAFSLRFVTPPSESKISDTSYLTTVTLLTELELNSSNQTESASAIVTYAFT